MIIPIEIGIHSGDNTHHHDQLILSINFRVTKTIVKSPMNPIPLPDEDDDDILISYFIF